MNALDDVWLDAASRLGIPVERGGDAYVHFDGARLHIADDVELDADDTVAQLVLHEICHALVQGPAHRHTVDWGLDNTDDRDAARERAAVRLQAHLCGAFGLRAHLFPTTVVRAFFESLPPDALGGRADDSSAMARLAALRAAERPWAPVLRSALDASARLCVTAPRHPKSGHPLAAAVDGEALTCGDCAWRTRGGLCRQAPRRAFVDEQSAACVRWEAALDCTACGACCRSAYDAVEVSRRDPVVKRHPELVLLRGDRLDLRRAGDRCAALAGPDGGPWRCTIYDDRPRTCREFAVAGKHCLEARRKVGLSL